MKKLNREQVIEILNNGKDFRECNLSGLDLSKLDLTNADLSHANLRGADLRGADLRYANLRDTDLRQVDLDYSCLPLWCGSQFKTDERITKQISAHLLRILKLSELNGTEQLINELDKYAKGWHRDNEF